MLTALVNQSKVTPTNIEAEASTREEHEQVTRSHNNPSLVGPRKKQAWNIERGDRTL